jgi:hypothetical protein
MDIDSINAGTVDTKGWLNPVVGTLRAKKVICDDIEDGGASVTVTAQKFQIASPVLENLFIPMGGAVSCRTAANFSTTLNTLTFTEVSATATSQSFVFPTKLELGSVYEYYLSGEFTNPAGTSGALQFYPAFNNNTPTGASGNFMGEYLIPFVAKGLPATPSAFELKITFRVTAFTDTTVTCEGMSTGIAGGPDDSYVRVQRGYDPQPSNTPARTSFVIPFFVWAKGQGSYTLTRTISYLRQIC